MKTKKKNKKKLICLLVVIALLLAVLIIIFLFQFSKRKKEPEKISVILSSFESRSSKQFGMEQAAKDLGIELRILVLGTTDSTNEQRELFQREIDGDSSAIIFTPIDTEKMSNSVELASESLSIITLSSDMSIYGANACITPDNAEIGKTLAESALNGAQKNGKVLILNNSPKDTSLQERIYSCEELLSDNDRTVTILDIQQEDVEAGLRKQFANMQSSYDAIICLDPSIFEIIGSLSKESPSQLLIYGVGITNAIAAYIEDSVVSVALVQNDFLEGYLAVSAAYESIRSNNKKQISVEKTIQSVIVRKENMYDSEIQKLVFPLTR